MNIKLFFISAFVLLFSACANNQNTKQLTVKKSQESVVTVQKKSIYKLSKNEQEFLQILEKDKYASLCSSQEKYIKIKKLEDSKKKSLALKELFYEYTNNLANSCIDQDSFQRVLKSQEYKKRKQSYKSYTTKLDKQSILKKFDDNILSVESILKEYTPSHPDFFKFIKKLDINSLTAKNYNKLRLNIERLKLIKDYNTDTFIELNIPSYKFTLYENGLEERNFGTIVGKKESQTPILSSNLSHFIINPAWNIPDSIAKKTIIPRALKDKSYLKRKNIVIKKSLYDYDAPNVNFKDVNWKKYLKKDVKYIPYKFIQLPSSTNGMGKVKYMFKNDHAVYMHDTIGTWRFKVNKEKIRSVSHGCVRLEHPISLMKHLTTYYTPQSYKKIRKTYLKGEMDTVNLSKSLPLHITYVTSYLDKKGNLKFHDDIYEYDKIQKLDFIPYNNALLLASLDK